MNVSLFIQLKQDPSLRQKCDTRLCCNIAVSRVLRTVLANAAREICSLNFLSLNHILSQSANSRLWSQDLREHPAHNIHFRTILTSPALLIISILGQPSHLPNFSIQLQATQCPPLKNFCNYNIHHHHYHVSPLEENHHESLLWSIHFCSNPSYTSPSSVQHWTEAGYQTPIFLSGWATHQCAIQL